jgi:hypothetical protein
MRTGLKWILVCVLIGSVLMMSGCTARETGNDQQDSALEASIVEPRTGAELSVTLDQDSIELTELLTVRAELRWEDGVRVELIEPDWGELGWTLESSRPGVVWFDGERFVREDVFMISPFLGGEYRIDGLGIRAGTAEIGKRIARLAPIEIVVSSVLSEDDGDVLEGEATLAAMPVEDTTREHSALIAIIAGGCVMIGIAALLYWHRTQEDEPGEIDPASVLMVAAHAEKLNEDDLGRLHRALIELKGQHSGLECIANEVEVARFSGAVVDSDAIQDAARRAAQVCGVVA